MNSSSNVIYLSKNYSRSIVDVSGAQMSPIARAIIWVDQAIAAISEERESLHAMVKHGELKLSDERIEELIQSVRIRAEGLTSKEGELMICLSEYAARKKNLVLYYDYENTGSIVVESIARWNSHASKNVKSATS